MIKVTYLFHSGFMVELDKNVFIFDYFKDNCKKNRFLDCGQLKENDIPDDKNVFIFVTHGHYDHYDKEIFRFDKPNVNYVFYDRIKLSQNVHNPYPVDVYKSIELNDVNIRTYGSTDEGLSFMVKAEGISIFHAGDLGWWHWEGETDEEKKYAEELFFKEMDKLINERIDIAFFPVDPRLEEAYCMGGEFFIKNMHPKIFVPMHFQDVYSVTKKFKEHMGDIKDTKILTIKERGEVIYSADM